MAFELIPYQPIKFEAPDLPGYVEVNDKGKIGRRQFKFKIAQNDFTKFQVINQSESNSPNTFPTILSGGNGFILHGTGESTVNEADLTLTANADYVFFPSRTYRIQFTISDLTEGTIEIYRGTDLIDTIENNGNYRYINASDGGTSDQENFYVTFVSCNVGTKISAYSAREYSDDLLLGIYDTDNALQDDQSDNITYVRDFATATIDWGSSGLTAGSFKLGLSNKANEILNENAGFDSTADWVLDLDSADRIRIVNSRLEWRSDLLSSSTATYPNILEPSKTYKVTVYASIIDAEAQATVALGTTAGANITEAGVYEQEIVSNGTDLVLTLETVSSVEANIEIGSIIVRESLDISDLLEEDIVFSQNMCLGDFEADTLMLTWADLADNMGFGYGDTNFINTLRIEGKIVMSGGGDQEYDSFVNSSMQRKILYFSELKVNELITELLPEYVHDAMMLIRGHDAFAIDDKSYKLMEGDYVPDKDENNDFEAPVTIEIHRSTQAPPKVRCLTGEDPSVTFPPSYILLEDGGKILLEDGSGAILKEVQF